MRHLAVDQFVVGAAGRAALGLALVDPEPDHGCVVLLTCRQEVEDKIKVRKNCCIDDEVAGTTTTLERILIHG